MKSAACPLGGPRGGCPITLEPLLLIAIQFIQGDAPVRRVGLASLGSRSELADPTGPPSVLRVDADGAVELDSLDVDLRLPDVTHPLLGRMARKGEMNRIRNYEELVQLLDSNGVGPM